MKGRNSTVVSIRLTDSVYAIIRAKANGQSVPGYIRDIVIRSVNTINDAHSVNTTDSQSESDVPLYNPATHKTGDRVKIWQNGKLVETLVP